MASGQASKAKRSVGMLLKIGNGASVETFTTLGDVLAPKQTGAKFDEVETTHLNSPIDDNGVQWKEFLLGVKDGGSIDCEVNLTMDDGQDILFAAEGTAKNFEWHFPQLVTSTYTKGLKFTFTALVGAVAITPDTKGVIKATFPLRLTGAMTKVALT